MTSEIRPMAKKCKTRDLKREKKEKIGDGEERKLDRYIEEDQVKSERESNQTQVIGCEF